jgi:hypothetical protein
MECLVIQFGPGAKTAITARPVSMGDTIYESRSSTLDDANAGQSRACQTKKDRSAIYTVINIQQMLRSRDAVNTFGWIFSTSSVSPRVSARGQRSDSHSMRVAEGRQPPLRRCGVDGYGRQHSQDELSQGNRAPDSNARQGQPARRGCAVHGRPDRRGSRPPMPPAATPSTFDRAATEQLCQVQRIGAHLFTSVILLQLSAVQPSSSSA